MKKTKSFVSVVGKKYDGMMGRCYRESDRSYKNYGLRNIKVCFEWIEDIREFRKWISNEIAILGISEKDFVDNSSQYQLDRRDNDGHYTPENCRIVTPQNNTRNRGGTTRQIYSSEGKLIEFKSKAMTRSSHE